MKSRGSSVGMALGYGLDDRGSRFRFLAGAGNFSLQCVHNGSGAHPASCPMGTRGSFPWIKRPGREADHSPPSSAEVKEWVELYLYSPGTPSWRGAQLRHRDNFLSLFSPTYATRTTHLILLDVTTLNIWWTVQSTNYEAPYYTTFSSLLFSLSLRSKYYLSSAPCSQTPSFR
jgi:hypothetical protein